MSEKPRILVTRRHLAEIETRLQRDYDIVLNEDDHVMTATEIIAAADGVDALFICVTEPLSRKTIKALPDSVQAIMTSCLS